MYLLSELWREGLNHTDYAKYEKTKSIAYNSTFSKIAKQEEQENTKMYKREKKNFLHFLTARK